MEGLPEKPENEPHVSTSEALQQIEAMKQQVLQTGAADTEIDRFSELQQRVQSGLLTPADGIRRAEMIVSGRQDYH